MEIALISFGRGMYLVELLPKKEEQLFLLQAFLYFSFLSLIMFGGYKLLTKYLDLKLGTLFFLILIALNGVIFSIFFMCY
jgi:hypothetical protein